MLRALFAASMALYACAAEISDAPETPELAIVEADQGVYALVRRGRELSASEAEELEDQLIAEPGNLAARTTLIGHYESGAMKPFGQASDARWARDAHVLWLIAHAPHASVLASPYAELTSWSSDRQEEALAMWRNQVAAHSNDPVVLWNAAASVHFSSEALSQRLLEDGRRLQPDDPDWSSRLGFVLSMQRKDAPEAERADLARRSLDAYEDALGTTLDEDGHFNLLADVADAALEAGEMKYARWYAEELLSMAESRECECTIGDAVHNGNMVLGRVALLEGDQAQAVVHLLRAGDTPGSAVLNSFGPKMGLAKALLERGEREAVLEYLKRCRRFWQTRELDERIAVVRDGGVPDFGWQ